MYRLWMIFDPRRALVFLTAALVAIVLLNHFVQLSSKYAFWLEASASGKAPVATAKVAAPAPAATN
jgi:light-harvesting complex 1 alpha chain